jgi:O-antigen/teichoic acid export membrane protein
VLAVSAAYSNALVAGHREDVVMRINIIGAVFNVTANAAAIPLLGIDGAAGVTVCSELLILTLTARAVVAAGLERSPGQIVLDFARWHGRVQRRR